VRFIAPGIEASESRISLRVTVCHLRVRRHATACARHHEDGAFHSGCRELRRSQCPFDLGRAGAGSHVEGGVETESRDDGSPKHPGTTRDYGTIGLLKTPHAQLLVFPRSLKRFADRRVVGIDYSLLASVPEKAKGGGSLPKAQAKKAATTASDPKSKRTREKAELISFGSGGDLADDAESPADAVSLDVVEKPVEPAAPPTWQELAEEIMQARKKLQQRRIAAAREQLLRLENWIRDTRKLSQEV
jgi:hypothetical protein